MKTGLVTLGVINIVTFCLFIPANVTIAREYFEEETIQLFDCLYNMLVAL